MRPEHIPKLLDGLDASVFAARQALRGYHGRLAAGLALTCLVFAAIVANPVARALLVAAGASFAVAELAWRIAVRRRRAMARPPVGRHRTARH